MIEKRTEGILPRTVFLKVLYDRRRLLQHEGIASRRAILGGLASTASMLALCGCAGLAATGADFDASSLSADPTLLVTTTRKPVNGGRAKPWFGPERASTMTVARAKLVPPDGGRFSLAAAGLADWRLDGVEPVSGRSAIFSRRPAADRTS